MRIFYLFHNDNYSLRNLNVQLLKLLDSRWKGNNWKKELFVLLLKVDKWKTSSKIFAGVFLSPLTQNYVQTLLMTYFFTTPITVYCKYISDKLTMNIFTFLWWNSLIDVWQANLKEDKCLSQWNIEKLRLLKTLKRRPPYVSTVYFLVMDR